MSMFAPTFRWLQRKRYQYEVTFSLYMLTPTEKFIFNLFILSFFSMIIIAACLYLPHHINFLVNRAWFYYHGEDTKTPSSGAVIPSKGEATTTNLVVETARATLKALREAGSEREL